MARRKRTADPEPDTQTAGEDTTDSGTTDNETRSSTVSNEIEFVDELPPVTRKAESGVWVERLAPLRDNVMKWAKLKGPTKNPHAVVANLQSGKVAGIPDLDWFEFKGRNVATGQTEEVPVLDDEGNETGETKTQEVKEGYVFGRYMDPDRKAERDSELAAKREKRAARQAESENEPELV